MKTNYLLKLSTQPFSYIPQYKFHSLVLLCFRDWDKYGSNEFWKVWKDLKNWPLRSRASPPPNHHWKLYLFVCLFTFYQLLWWLLNFKRIWKYLKFDPKMTPTTTFTHYEFHSLIHTLFLLLNFKDNKWILKSLEGF